MISINELVQLYPSLLKSNTEQKIADSLQIESVASVDDFTNNDIIVCSSVDYVEKIKTNSISPAALIIPERLSEFVPEGIPCLTTNNPRLAQALIKQHLNDYDASDSEWPSVHSSAIIHESASIGNSCRIGPNVVIGENVSIGDNTIIRSNSVIEHDSTIGEKCIIHSLVNIGYQSQIADNVIIRPGAIIGNEGFGFAPDENKQYHRIPHTGKVVIEEWVQIGANCNIDRGTYGETRIGKRTKLDSLCHIAHNVEIGEDCVITSHCVIAGSSKIGNEVIMSGQTGVLDHITIADGTTLVHRAGVLQSIPEKGVWGGLPAKPLKEHMKRSSLDKSVDKKIAKLEARLKKLESKS